MNNLWNMMDDKGKERFRKIAIIFSSFLMLLAVITFIPNIFLLDFFSWDAVASEFMILVTILSITLAVKQKLGAHFILISYTFLFMGAWNQFVIPLESVQFALQSNTGYTLLLLSILVAGTFLKPMHFIIIGISSVVTITVSFISSGSEEIIESLQYWLMGLFLFWVLMFNASKILRAILLRLNSQAEENRLLLREIHHRIKNNLQMISSLISLNADTSINDESRRLAAEMRTRILAISQLHDLIYKTSDKPIVILSHYLLQVWEIFQQASGKLPNAEFVFKDFECDWQLAMTMGMVFSELSANIIKHSGQGNNPEVRFELAQEQSVIILSCFNSIETSDYTPEQQPNYGTKIIQALLQKYRGTLEIRNVAKGVMVVIQVPFENMQK